MQVSTSESIMSLLTMTAEKGSLQSKANISKVSISYDLTVGRMAKLRHSAVVICERCHNAYKICKLLVGGYFYNCTK